ncbi:DUF817 domain-containing protein [Noviherbaspirillum sp.]|uniref:DUF817 domain-containing protein n=1 Tax=Noviherbaspirillum sp. TaxID=1926288 RepID=UPI003FA53FB1
MLTALVRRIDERLLAPAPSKREGFRRFLAEFLMFGIKEARACLFAGLFFCALFLSHKLKGYGIPRYDLLLLIAIGIQAWMLHARLETMDEFKAILVFHAIGIALEVYKTSMGSWSYPEFAYTKILGVPLYAGFMHAAVASYVIQAWRLFDLRIERHPPYWMAGALAVVIYANFYTHHFIGDYRWYLIALACGLYARTMVVFRPLDRDRRMPLVLAFVLIGFFIWIAENLSTFLGAWRYPNQIGAWALVHVGKWSSWSLLTMMTFIIVVELKHIKARIQLAP